MALDLHVVMLFCPSNLSNQTSNGKGSYHVGGGGHK